MSKIPEGATHTFGTIAGVGYRRQIGSRWEGYVDGDWVLLCGGMPQSYVPIQSETEWTGEGLPPVGFEGFAKSNRTRTFRACIVLAIRQGMAVVSFTDQEELQWASEFKTQSQVEAERDRSLMCDRIYGIITGPGVERKGNTRDMSEALYDAGLRFVEVTK